MRCVKTGCQCFLTDYGEWVYGDAFVTDQGTWIFRIVERSFAPIAPVYHFTVQKIDHWFEDRPVSTLIASVVENHGYEGAEVL